ncbi:hypothetical protein [Rhizobium johnstonii]|uniref:hypothetical protein n=1 Tax=Rhizobium johnstonii TaxID=3019933 RepID=UPI003F9B7377
MKVLLDGSWFGIGTDGNLIDVPEEKPFPFRMGEPIIPQKRRLDCVEGRAWGIARA